MKYNARKRPDPDQWLSLDEDERLELIVAYHERIEERLPKARLHGAIHTVVVNQIAMGEEVPNQKMRRLRMEGLDRHDAVHAVGSVLATQIHDVLSDASTGGHEAGKYSQELAELTAKKWRKQGRENAGH